MSTHDADALDTDTNTNANAVEAGKVPERKDNAKKSTLAHKILLLALLKPSAPKPAPVVTPAHANAVGLVMVSNVWKPTTVTTNLARFTPAAVRPVRAPTHVLVTKDIKATV